MAATNTTATNTEYRCADDAFARDEPMFATASQVQRWLLVEQSGPFSAESVPAGRIGHEALQHLSRLTRDVHARLVLIRRPPRVAAESGLRLFFADVRPGHEQLRTRLVANERALCDLTLDGPEWVGVADPIYLVCTHGKHDPCCALRGRPVVAAIADTLEAGRVWETSHVGGDRFAGNVVSLPSGVYLGRVEPEEASAVVELIDSGRVPVHYLRGRSSLSAPAQAAQHYARTVGGYGAYDGIGDLLPVRVEPVADASDPTWTVILACPVGDLTVTVRRATNPQPAQLTCHAEEPKFYPSFALVGIERS